ncbi:MAG: HD domain-containing protein [bacterium]|nr:HD domain-containing protein [bacterium]
MGLPAPIFSNTLARRIFILFLVCALVPFGGISIFAYRHVTTQLAEQSSERLRQSAKTHSLSIYERLLSLEADLGMLVSLVEMGIPLQEALTHAELDDRILTRFSRLAVITEGRKPEVLVGSETNVPAGPSLTPSVLLHLRRPGTWLTTSRPSSSWEREITLFRIIQTEGLAHQLLAGTVQTDFLWGQEQGSLLNGQISVVVLDEASRVLFSTLSDPTEVLRQVAPVLANSHSSKAEIGMDGERFLIAHWSLFTKPRFHTQSWTVLLLESRKLVLAPVASFRAVFPFAVLATFWVVLLLSIRAIRHRMAPLELLKAATRHIAEERFNWRVDVRSGDEFEDLAHSFNEMAERLQGQFSALATRAEIDRAILSSLNAQDVASTVVSRASELFACEVVMLALFYRKQPTEAQLVFRSLSSGHGIAERDISFEAQDLEQLRKHPEYAWLGRDNSHLPPALSIVSNAASEAIAFPVLLGERLAAVLAFSGDGCSSFNQNRIASARQMADQLAVALANAELVEELHQLNLGTIEAFARAVDAKSPWTAGHSERVTVLALGIGENLGLDPSELDSLHRGALLHDIGKLGVSASILDKAADLTVDEWQSIKAHSAIGVRILEPIPAFHDILTTVGQHHERYDGSGYPDHLVGDAIDIKARILSVADVYDAMTSHRPYRQGLHEESVVDLIVKDSGKKYDPDVIQAFVRVVTSQQGAFSERHEDSAQQVSLETEEGAPS